jgi:hypothetical protein
MRWLLISGAGVVLAAAPALSQQGTGTPGSPSAATAINKVSE